VNNFIDLDDEIKRDMLKFSNEDKLIKRADTMNEVVQLREDLVCLFIILYFMGHSMSNQ